MVAALLEKHAVEAIAIASGSGSRETHRFFRTLLRTRKGPRPVCMVVSDAGVGAYAISRAARDEFRQLVPPVRAAVSIARRLQDPLSELVRVDPKLIGVGQYQHDVNQQALRDLLEAVVRSCVTAVGVDVNRAHATLLAHVAGLDKTAADHLASQRQERGRFASRAEVEEALRATPGRYEEAAPFLRIYGGGQPLDATAIHPEHYPLVERMAADAGTPVAALLGNREAVARIDFARYASDAAGQPTLALIRDELLHPARDPRQAFRPVECRDDVTDLEHLTPGMLIEGTVTNVTNFGAFVDIGVPVDGLIHLSELSRRYVRDAGSVVHVGQTVRAKVLSVDAERRRISLSIKQAPSPARRKKSEKPPQQTQGQAKEAQPKQGQQKPKRPPNAKATAEDIARLIAHFGSR